MSKKFLRLSALLTAVIMTATLASCGKSGTDSDYSSGYDYSSVVSSAGSEDQSGENTSSDNASSGTQSSSGSSGGTSSSSSGSNGNSKFLVNPEDYRGTTVVYVTWKDPKLAEDGPVIEAFEKKYGITVKIQLVDQEKYLSQISASIASGQQGDIFFENGTFPGSLSVMQPLDNAMINFDDPIWNQNTINASKIGGHSYLVDTISNIWSEVDICVYNKKIFADNNLTTPEELYKAGKWTFENFRKLAQQVSALGKDYIGAEINSETALGAAQVGFFSYKDEKMSVSVNDKLYEVMRFLAQMKTDGIAEIGHRAFNDGKTGMGLTNAFALKKSGYFTSINPDHVGVTYLPVWKEGNKNVQTGIYRGWGLIKGAKNPVAAGIFLREYLDINNYDVSNAFLTDELSNFFFQVTGETSDVFYYYGNSMVKSTGLGTEFADRWSTISPDQIRTYIEGQLNVMNEMSAKANEIIQTEKEWLKEEY